MITTCEKCRGAYEAGSAAGHTCPQVHQSQMDYPAIVPTSNFELLQLLKSIDKRLENIELWIRMSQ